MAANTVFNIIAIGLTGLLSIPALTSEFAQPKPEKITINIGVGATNSNNGTQAGTNGPGGNIPAISLFDVNGNDIGRTTSNIKVVDGGSITLTIAGTEGSSVSTTPAYIQLVATASDEICIAWLTTTSSSSGGADFRSWNGATGAFCNVPWYPSTAQFPGVSAVYQPPCIWMSNDGRFIDAFSAHLFDFFFPGSSSSTSMAEQWGRFPDTLCKAPARQQFYNNTGECIPFYPSGLKLDKDPETGFEKDFDAVESSFTMKCSAAGMPFNCGVDLVRDGPGNAACSATVDTNPRVTLPPSITSDLKSVLTLDVGGGHVVPTSSATMINGEGNFGGIVSEIPKTEAGQPPVQTSDGVGNFGGIVGEIPASEFGQLPVATSSTDIIVKTTEQAATKSGSASIQAGDQGAVIVSMNHGGVGGTWEAVPTASTLPRAGARAKAHREADRAAIVRHSASEPTSTSHAAITQAPTQSVRNKKQQQSSRDTTGPIPDGNRHLPVLERSLAKRTDEPHNWCQENQLVISEHSSHSAIQVCESVSSWGPDFVSIVEGVYCDMCTRRHYQLCNGKQTSTPCFDLEEMKLRGSARWWRRDNQVGPAKRYDNVRYWK